MSAAALTRRDALRLGGGAAVSVLHEKEGVPPLESLKANLELFKKLRS